jgi:rubrerythrin
MDNATKRKLLSEFNTMKMIEQDAHEFYVKASHYSTVTDPKIRHCFCQIAEEEKYHIELVDRIMNIINNCV